MELDFDDDDYVSSSSTNKRQSLRRTSLGASSTSATTTHRANKQTVYSDRFIPARASLGVAAASAPSNVGDVSFRTQMGSTPPSSSTTSPSKSGLFSLLLRSELLGEDVPISAGSVLNSNSFSQSNVSPAAGGSTTRTTPTTIPSPTHHAPTQTFQSPSLLRFRRSMTTNVSVAGMTADTSLIASSPTQRPSTIRNNLDRSSFVLDDYSEMSSTLSPLRSATSMSLLQSPLLTPNGRSKRKIPKVPFKTLDAPALADDFYLNNVDWSCRNVVAVGLGESVFLWSAHTSSTTLAGNVSLPADGGVVDDEASCVNFTESGTQLAVGTRAGHVCIYDVETSRITRRWVQSAHEARIGVMAWNGSVLATGSRDRRIRERDMRAPMSAGLIRDAVMHRQEVCGLKYSFEGMNGPTRLLASGGNDNKLYVWDARHAQPIYRLSHNAAVKALAFSPHQSGILSSGGGTADRCIKIWSTVSGSQLSSIDTGSQVCNLVFSKTMPELVSTHGYSLNQICVWRAINPNTMPLQKIATLQGHALRVLYLAISPDGSTVVTGAGDECLKFWSIWPGRSSSAGSMGSKLGGLSLIPGAGASLR